MPRQPAFDIQALFDELLGLARIAGPDADDRGLRLRMRSCVHEAIDPGDLDRQTATDTVTALLIGLWRRHTLEPRSRMEGVEELKRLLDGTLLGRVTCRSTRPASR